jgi:hypothetical protein
MANMMHFLVEGAAFTPGTDLKPGCLPPHLAPSTPAETSEMRISGLMRAMAAEAIAQGTVPLLSFADFTGHSCVTQRPLQAPHLSSQSPSGT